MPALEHAVVFRLRSVTSPALRHEKLYCCRVKRGDVNTTLPPVRCQLSTLTGPQSWNGSARVHFKSGGSGPNGYQPKIITIDIFEKEKNAKLVGSAQVDITKVLKDGEQSGVLEGHALDFRGLAGGGVTFGATLTIDIAVYPSAQEQPPFTSAPPPADEDLEEDEATAEKVDMTEVNQALEDVEAELARYKNAIELRRQLTTAAEQAVTLATRRRVDAYTLATWSTGAYKQDPQAQPPNPATAVSKRQVLAAKLQETREAAKQTDDAIVAAMDRVKIQQAKLGPLEKATEARTALLKKQHDLELAQAVREIADEFIALLGEIAEADAAVEKAQNDAGVTDLQHLKQRLAADERTLADLRFTARRHATSIADLEKQIGYLSADVTEFQQFNAKLLTALGSNLAQSAASHGVVALPEPDLQAASVGDTTTSTDMLSRTARSNRPLDDIFGGSSTSNASTIIATTAAAEMPPVRSQSPAGSLAQPQVIQQQQQPPQQQPLAAAQTMSAAPSMSSLGGNMPQATCTTPSVPSSAASARSGTTPGTSAAWTELNFSAPVAPQPSAATTVVVSDSGFLSSQSSRAGTTTSDVWAQQPLRAPQQPQQQQPDFSAQPQQQQQQQQTSQPQQAAVAAQATEDVMQVSRSIDLSHTVTLCLQPGLPTKPAEASATSPNKSQLKAAEKEANEADLTERKAESKRLVKSQPQSAVDYDPFGADPSPPCSLAATVADLSTATATESDKKKDDPLSLMERAVAARDAAPAFDPFAAAVQETEAAKPTEPVFDAASLFEAAPSAAPAPPTADLFAQPMAQQQQQQPPEVVLESFSATTGSLQRTATTLDETLFADAPSCKVGEPTAPSQVAPVQAPIKAVWGGNRVVDDVERDEELARAFNNIPHTPLVARADNSTPQAAVDNTASRGASPAPLPAVRSASSAAVFDPFGGATMGSDPTSDAALFAPRSTSPQQQTMRTATPPPARVAGLLDAQGKKDSEGPAHDADLFRDLAGAPMAQLKQMPAKAFTPPPQQVQQQQQPSPSSIRTSPSLQQHQDPFAMNTAATTNASAQPVKQVPSMHSVEDDFFGASPQRGASSSQCQSPPARVAAEHDDIFREFNGATSMSGTGHSQSPQQTTTVPVVATTAGSINDIFGF